jgi:hypothetical protein
MFLNLYLKQSFLVALLVVSIPAYAAVEPRACGISSDECLESCKRFSEGDARFNACNNVCSRQSKVCAAPPVASPAPLSEPAPTEPAASTSLTPASEEPAQDSTAAAPQTVVSETQAVQPPIEPAAQSEPEPTTAPTTAPTTPVSTSASVPSAKVQPPVVASIATKKAVFKESEKNKEMHGAIRAGNLNAIRRLIEVQGLNPTYVFGYDYNPQTQQFEGKVTRLQLSEIFADTNTQRNDAAGLDRILALFLELGMDVKATMTMPADGGNTTAAQREMTAWGPSLRQMETARDRDARLRTLEIALQNGLVPNDDFAQWLFAELPQVCGRDKSKFAIQVVDLLAKYLGPTLGPSLQDHFWRQGEHGPETVSDVVDLSFAPPQARTPREKAQFALQDNMWEQCALLSRRINRLLVQGK